MPVQATSLATDLLHPDEQRMETLGHSTPGHRTLLCFTHVGIVTFGNVSPRLSLGPSWRGGAGRGRERPAVRHPHLRRHRSVPLPAPRRRPGGVAVGRPGPCGSLRTLEQGGPAVPWGLLASAAASSSSLLSGVGVHGAPKGAPDSCADTRSHPVAASKPRAELSSKLAPFSFGQHLGALA